MKRVGVVAVVMEETAGLGSIEAAEAVHQCGGVWSQEGPVAGSRRRPAEEIA